MAAIPYLWYWIVGGLVAVLIATVAIFSERITPDLVGNKTISSEIEDSSGADLDEIVTDQQNDIVPEQANTHDKIENILENKETEVVLEQRNDETVSEEKINIDPPKLETVRIVSSDTRIISPSIDLSDMTCGRSFSSISKITAKFPSFPNVIDSTTFSSTNISNMEPG